MPNTELTIKECQNAIEDIRLALVENPLSPDTIYLIEQIELLQKKGLERIEDLRLAINYSRNANSFPYINEFDCMYCHKEIASIFKYLDTGRIGKLDYKIPVDLDVWVQFAIAIAERQNYEKKYQDF